MNWTALVRNRVPYFGFVSIPCAEVVEQVGCRVLKLAALLDNDALVDMLERHVNCVLESTGLPPRWARFGHHIRDYFLMRTWVSVSILSSNILRQEPTVLFCIFSFLLWRQFRFTCTCVMCFAHLHQKRTISSHHADAVKQFVIHSSDRILRV